MSFPIEIVPLVMIDGKLHIAFQKQDDPDCRAVPRVGETADQIAARTLSETTGIRIDPIRLRQVKAVARDGAEKICVIYAAILRPSDLGRLTETYPVDEVLNSSNSGATVPRLAKSAMESVRDALTHVRQQAAISTLPVLFVNDTSTVPDMVQAWAACGVNVDQSTLRRKLLAKKVLFQSLNTTDRKASGRPPTAFKVSKDPIRAPILFDPLAHF